MRAAWLLLCLATGVNAQESGAPDILGPVGSPLMCRHDTLTPADVQNGVAISLVFAEGLGQLRDRELHASYKSDGVPLRLIVIANLPTPSAPFNTHAILVYFGPDGRALGLRSRRSDSDSTATADNATTSSVVQMSEAETARARALAERLWQIRCAGRPDRSNR